MKIFINPGHEPSTDPGACGNGLREADVVRSIAKLVDKYLKAAGLETKIYQFDGLYAICDTANFWNSDLFVSIHCNAASSPYAKGTETFYYYGSNAGARLAEKIQNQIVNSLPVVNRGTKTANFTVLVETNCPAVLVETAFVTNSDDAKLLADNKDDFARAIARGITDFLQSPTPDVIDRH